MYYQVEQIVDYYHWTLGESKKLSVRERRHWFDRIKAKKESIKK